MTSTLTPDSDLRRPFEGQLNKFTNVMKGWQYRWFSLDPETGQLDYFITKDERMAKPNSPRGTQHLAAAVVLPSDEDSQTFHVNFASGESFKLRAANVRDRLMWVDRIRAVTQMHDRAIAANNSGVAVGVGGGAESRPPTPPGARSHITNGEPSRQLQHLSLSVLDAFGSVHDIFNQTELKHVELCKSIEALPIKSQKIKKDMEENVEETEKGPFCFDEDLLLIKATSKAAVGCVQKALSLLQDIQQLQHGPLANQSVSQHISKSVFALPSPFVNSSPMRSVNSFFVPTSVAPPSPKSKKGSVSQRESCIGNVAGSLEDANSTSTYSLPADLKASNS